MESRLACLARIFLLFEPVIDRVVSLLWPQRYFDGKPVTVNQWMSAGTGCFGGSVVGWCELFLRLVGRFAGLIVSVIFASRDE